MSNAAVLIENLGKQYRLGGTERYQTLRDTMARAARAFAGKLSGQSTGKKKREERFWALRDISLEIQPGDVVGILGRNGAGKSTLLKILSRVTGPTTGRARLRGRIGSLLEVGTGFHPELSGRDNIRLNGSILGMSKAEIAKHFDEIVAFAEIEKFLDMPVKNYSSGMYMRLAFAVAAHLDPEILVIDEVLAVGDTAFQKKCLTKMDSVAREGRTILFVSHNMAAVSALCSKGVLLQEGKVVMTGPITDVVQRYSSSAGVSSTTHWVGDYGDENARLKESWVKSLDRDGAFDTASNLEVGIRINVLQPIEGLVLGFRLISQYDQELAYVLYDDADSSTPPTAMPGEITKRFIIPGNTLASGVYKISVSVGIHNFKAIVLYSDHGSLMFELENVRGIGRRYPTPPLRGYTSIFRPNWPVV